MACTEAATRQSAHAAPPALQQQHAALRRPRQSLRQHTTRGAAPHNDVVVLRVYEASIISTAGAAFRIFRPETRDSVRDAEQLQCPQRPHSSTTV